MIVLPTTHKLQAVLAGAVTTNQPHFWVDYMDTTADTVGESDGTLNSTTDVDIVAAPGADQRLVRQVHIYNADTVAVTVTVKTDAGGTERNLIKMTLQPAEALIYNSASGWNVQSVSYNGSYQPLDSDLTAIANAGAVDFGAFTSFEVPNGAGGTTVNATGEVCVDSTSQTLNFYDGAAEAVLNPTLKAAFFLESPAAADDIPIIRLGVAATLVQVNYAIGGGTNWVGQLQEADDAQGTNAADTQAADSTVTGSTQVTSFSNASFDAGDYVRLKTTSVSGTVPWLHVTLQWRQNP